MIYADRMALGFLDVPQDAFSRMRCPSCNHVPVLVDADRKMVHCEGCGWMVDRGPLMEVVRHTTCAVCHAVAARFKASQPRCAICQAKWIEDGKPDQSLSMYVPLSMPLDWHTVPLLDVAGYTEYVIGVRKAENGE